MTEPPTRKDLEGLKPEFRLKLTAALADVNRWCAKHHPEYRFVVVETVRTQERQDWLYASGRTRPGPIVTKVHESKHTKGVAADCVPMKGADLDWDAPQDVWDYYGHALRRQELFWGGDWTHFKDLPHAEMA